MGLRQRISSICKLRHDKYVNVRYNKEVNIMERYCKRESIAEMKTNIFKTKIGKNF